MQAETQIVNEKSRTYLYESNEWLQLGNIESVRVSESGNHYVKHRGDDGKIQLVIVAPGWRSIIIDPGPKQDWTF